MSRFIWRVGIITADRPGGSLLAMTVRSVLEAGFSGGRTTVFCQVGSRPPEQVPPGVLVSDGSVEPGAYRNWRHALKSLLDDCEASIAPADSTRLIVLEDDVLVSLGLREYLDCLPPPPDGVASLYSAAPNDESDSLFGWIRVARVPQRAFGALGYVFTPDLARRFLDSAPLTHKPHGTDHAVGLWCRDRGVPYYVHAPSFLVHRGAKSSVPDAGVDANRQCRRFIRSIAATMDPTTEVTRVRADVVDQATGECRTVAVTRPAGR